MNKFTTKSFIRLTPGAYVIKLFTAVSYDFSEEGRVIVPSKPFQPNLMFAGKTGAYPSKAPFRFSTLG
jgi:hypothetical protein